MTAASTAASVVLCTRNQCGRLRLALRALSTQATPPREIIVVDDASEDATREVVEAARSWIGAAALRYERLAERRGSAGARNRGAGLATGDLLLFLDGDVLATPAHVARHLAFQAEHGPAVCIGPLWHTTTTEFLRDPSRGDLFDVPIPRDRLQKLQSDLKSFLIEESDVVERFSSIVARSAPGTYPHLGEMEAAGVRLGYARGHGAAWVLMTPQNVSVPRDAFLAVGGFDERLPFCEGWDLTLRLKQADLPLFRIPDAPIYHIYHYHPFSDFEEHLKRWRAMKMIAAKLDHRALVLVQFFFGFLGRDPWLPKEMGPFDLDHLATLLERHRGDDLGPYEVIVRGHPLLAEAEDVSAPG